jgi:hypothetical protein
MVNAYGQVYPNMRRSGPSRAATMSEGLWSQKVGTVAQEGPLIKREYTNGMKSGESSRISVIGLESTTTRTRDFSLAESQNIVHRWDLDHARV